MYNTSYSVADLSRASQQRGQRSLHGSQSHANLHFGTATGPSLNDMSMGPGASPAGFGVNQQSQPYMPGYLLAASQGQAPPAPVKEFTFQPLENDKTLKRTASGFARGFGEESLLSAARPSPKGRSPRTPLAVADDENAPPTVSIADAQYANLDGQPSRLSARPSVGGFHPLSKTFTPNTSMSTTFEASMIDQDGDMSMESQGYSVTVFGFRPEERQEAINAFMERGAHVVGEEDPNFDKSSNWFEIIYPNQRDAIRAVMKSGRESLGGGRILLGAKWTDETQAPVDDSMILGESSSHTRSQSMQISQTGAGNTSMIPHTQSRTRLKPASNAFRSATIATSSRANWSEGPMDEWGLPQHAKRVDGATVGARPAGQEGGMLSRVSSMVFGWS